MASAKPKAKPASGAKPKQSARVAKAMEKRRKYAKPLEALARRMAANGIPVLPETQARLCLMEPMQVLPMLRENTAEEDLEEELECSPNA